MMRDRTGTCYVDENGVFCREKIMPFYRDVSEVAVVDLERLRNRWLELIRDGRLGSEARGVQMVCDDIDFLVRGGTFQT